MNGALGPQRRSQSRELVCRSNGVADEDGNSSRSLALQPSFRSYHSLPTSPKINANNESGEIPILQFTSAVYFVEEDEGSCRVDIMRIGPLKGTVSCYYSTEDFTGKAGWRYEALQGEIVFEGGEYQKPIYVDIVEDRKWAATLEFKVILSQPHGCSLGAYLHTCRVKVIDTDSFPTSRYPQVVQGMEQIKSVGPLTLVCEFCRMNFTVQGIAWRTGLCLLFDQMRNAFIFYKLWATEYLLNVVFHDVKGNPTFTVNQRAHRAMLIGAGYIAPMLLLHVWDLIRVRLDISGRTRCFLQQNLITKYLNYDETARSEVSIAAVQLAVREDADEMAEGYMSFISILELIVKLVVMTVFLRTANSREPVLALIVIVALMLVFACCRYTSLYEAMRPVEDKSENLQVYVGDVAKNYRLISNYQQRPKINELASKKCKSFRNADLQPKIIKTNNDYFALWLGPIFAGIYIMSHARGVLNGDLGTGTFVATLSVFTHISKDFSEGYQKFMRISSRALCVQMVTDLMNRPTDVLAWKDVNQKRRSDTEEALRALVHQRTCLSCPIDSIPFRFKNVSFSHNDFGDETLRNVNLSITQGSKVAILGGHGHGRNTFLRLIAHELFPTSGEVFIPTHLRILMVTQEWFLLEQSVLENLTLGISGGDPMHQLSRIKHILEELRATKVMEEIRKISKSKAHVGSQDSSSEDSDSDFNDERKLSYLECCQGSNDTNEKQDGSWIHTLSYTEKVVVHLVRAFIMNPEVMILHRPNMHFNSEAKHLILDLICKHVQNRGVGLPPETVSMRRPRTVFVSLQTPEQAKQMKADVVWRMSDPQSGHPCSVVVDEKYVAVK